MTVHRIADAAELLGVSDDTLRRWLDAGRVPKSHTEDGRAGVAGGDLAALARNLGDDRNDSGSRVSARNRFRGIVTAVERDNVMAQVEMYCGRHRVVALMSREAADDLGLEPGVVAVASVKATTVVVELP